MAYEVCREAAAAKRLTSIAPLPERVKEEVCSSACLGSRKTSVQVRPAVAGGMSKVKMLLVVGVTVPE